MKASAWYPWFEIPDDEWGVLVELAAARERLQATAHTSRFWRADPHLPGLCGEWVYGVLTGQEMDRTPEIWHDSRGEDFPGVDVKATTWWRDPHLRVSDHQRMKAPYYFAVAVNVDARLVKPLGYATRAMLTRAATHDYGKGHAAHRLRPHELLTADELFARTLRRAA